LKLPSASGLIFEMSVSAVVSRVVMMQRERNAVGIYSEYNVASSIPLTVKYQVARRLTLVMAITLSKRFVLRIESADMAFFCGLYEIHPAIWLLASICLREKPKKRQEPRAKI
jgi:hypothetical protein